MSQAERPSDSKPETNVSKDVATAIEAKRDALERLAKSDYSVADHAGALLELADGHN